MKKTCSYRGCSTMPSCMFKIVEDYGADCPVPVGRCSKNDPGHYIQGWENEWLVARLFNQWRYFKAIKMGLQPARSWFWDADDHDAADWKTTAMHVMNAEYGGNASYEWFDYKEDENGEKHMYRVNYFERIENTDDPRIQNPALDYLFSHPDLTICAAYREFKNSLEKKN